jgi:hypothetical protein
LALDHVARCWQLRLGNRLGGSPTVLDHGGSFLASEVRK